MPPSDSRRIPRPSALDERMSSLRELASNPSFSRLTSSGQVRQLARLKERSEGLALSVPLVIAGRYRVLVPFHEKKKTMSAVFLTKDAVDDDLVVVKMASDSSDLKSSTLAIRREHRALSRIEHDNVVRLRDAGIWEGRDFLVLDYLKGADLYLLLSDYHNLPWRTAMLISLQLCDALHAAHDKEIVHSDLKPENVVISRMDGIKATLLDFGLAKFMDAPPDDDLMPIPGRVVGTFPYMAPETFNRDFDYRADVFSLGVMMYEMLTGRNPFDGADIPEMVDFILNLVPEPPSSRTPLPGNVDEMVMHAIEKSPEDRFQTIVEMRRAIESCRQL